MVFGEVDWEVVHKVLQALMTGMRKVEAATAGGKHKVTGYFVTDKQIRIDIKEEAPS